MSLRHGSIQDATSMQSMKRISTVYLSVWRLVCDRSAGARAATPVTPISLDARLCGTQKDSKTVTGKNTGNLDTLSLWEQNEPNRTVEYTSIAPGRIRKRKVKRMSV